MDGVRVGIIGTGGMAQSHIDRLLADPSASVAALCDIRQEALDRTVSRHPALEHCPQFGNFTEMISGADLDAVQIVTPHTVHFEQIIACLDRGLHVLCEKPMVCTVPHARQVIQKIEDTGRVFVLSYQRHYQAEFLYIRDEIARGEVGGVQFVQGLQCQNWMRGTVGSWRQDPALSGGGQLNDSGSHLLAALLFTTGLPVQEVAAYIDNLGTPVDINSAVSVRFVGGAQGNISVVGNAPTWHEDMTIWCDHGVFFLRNGKLEVCGPGGKRDAPTAQDMPAGSNPDANFIGAILGKEKVGSPAVWGLRVIELTAAAWNSAETGAPTRVESTW